MPTTPEQAFDYLKAVYDKVGRMVGALETELGRRGFTPGLANSAAVLRGTDSFTRGGAMLPGALHRHYFRDGAGERTRSVHTAIVIDVAGSAFPSAALLAGVVHHAVAYRQVALPVTEGKGKKKKKGLTFTSSLGPFHGWWDHWLRYATVTCEPDQSFGRLGDHAALFRTTLGEPRHWKGSRDGLVRIDHFAVPLLNVKGTDAIATIARAAEALEEDRFEDAATMLEGLAPFRFDQLTLARSAVPVEAEADADESV